LIVKVLGDRIPHFMEITLDTQVLAFTLLLSVVAGILAVSSPPCVSREPMSMKP